MLANSADPDEMPHMWHFIWVFTVYQSTYLGIYGLQKVKYQNQMTGKECGNKTCYQGDISFS